MSRLHRLGFDVRSIDVLGVRVDDVTLSQALDVCLACVRSGEPHQVVTPNAEFVMAARRDPAFRKILNNATLAIPDGAGLLLAGRLLGTPLREQVAGTDLAAGLAGRCAQEGYRIFLLGAAPGVADLAARRLRERYPALIVAGTFPGSADPSADEDTRAVLRQTGGVDVILVAYGAKRQEAWIDRNQAALGIPLAIGVGGALDFFSGQVPRAPLLMRRAGLDWLFRLVVQPWRWRRQLALPRFVIAVAAESLRRRPGSGPHPSAGSDPDDPPP